MNDIPIVGNGNAARRPELLPRRTATYLRADSGEIIPPASLFYGFRKMEDYAAIPMVAACGARVKWHREMRGGDTPVFVKGVWRVTGGYEVTEAKPAALPAIFIYHNTAKRYGAVIPRRYALLFQMPEFSLYPDGFLRKSLALVGRPYNPHEIKGLIRATDSALGQMISAIWALAPQSETFVKSIRLYDKKGSERGRFTVDEFGKSHSTM